MEDVPKQKQWPKLTWCKDGSNRWRKRYRKKLYHFKRLPTETLEESYRRCLHLWEKLKVRLDANDPSIPKTHYQPRTLRTIDFTQKVLAEIEDVRLVLAGNDPETDSDLSSRLDWAEQQLASLVQRVAGTHTPRRFVATPDNITVRTLPSQLSQVTHEVVGFKEITRRAEIPNELRLSGNITWYLGVREKTASAIANTKRRLERFAQFFGPDRSVKEIDEKAIDDYARLVKDWVSLDKMSASTARDYFNDLKSFVRKVYSRGLLDTLPRNLSDKDLGVSVSDRQVEALSIETVQTMLNHADSDDLKLWFLLHLNCGYIAGDISELRQSEVDWKLGVITRKRTKTKQKGNVPIVRYLLWDETFRLLKKQRNKDHKPDALVLLDEHGDPLKVDRIGDDGERVRVETVVYQCSRFRARMEREAILDPCPTIRALRSTAATLIARCPTNSGFESLFLGHAPKTMAERHYVEPNWLGFHAALRWLGALFDQTTSKR